MELLEKIVKSQPREMNERERASLNTFNETLLRSFKCALTGEHVRIVRLPDGNEIALGENEELATIDLVS